MKRTLLSKIMIITGIVLAAVTVAVILITLLFGNSSKPVNVTKITEAVITINGESEEMTLPVVLQDLPHGTEVRVSLTVPQKPGDSLFFGSVYAPLTILSGDAVLYEYGAEGTYPFFMTDPPTTYDDILLPDSAGRSLQVEMIYLSPQDRESLSIHEPAVGEQREILRMLMRENGLQFLLAAIILILGVALVIMSLALLSFSYQRRALLFPGLLCLFAGAWQFGENRLSVYMLEFPSFLYVLDFCGLFFLVIPLYLMAKLFLNQEKERVLEAGSLVLIAAAAAAVVLQLTGLVGFHKSLYFFHILLPAAIFCLAGICLYRFIRYKNRNAGLFILPFTILLAAAILELMNYYLGFFSQNSAIFQIGLLIFFCAMAIYSGVSFRRNLTLQIRAIELQNEVKLQEQAIEAQKSRNELLLSHYEDVRKQRHDLRHHMRVLNDLLKNGNSEEAMDYIGSLTASLPSYAPEIYCDNIVVNSILCFYLQQMKEWDIAVHLRVQVPEDNPNITDSNLCIIFGNLVENAWEACQRIEGNRFMNLSSIVSGDMLFITMDNSTPAGNIRTYEGLYLSSKSHERGLGLRSIRSIAEKHDGTAEFREEHGVFQSEVCVKL